MRDIETIDAELRLLSRAWRVARHGQFQIRSTGHSIRILTSTGGNADGAPTSADGLWIGPAEPTEYNNVTYVAPMHMRSWKDCYAKFVPEEYLNKDNRYNAFDFRRAHLNLIDEKGYEMWLAKSAGTPVGVAIFGSDLEDHGRGKIQALYVDPDWQCRHVGTRQLDAVLDQLDYPVVVVDCVTQNEGGCSFWERRGFRPIGEGPSFPIEGYGDVDTVRYVLVRSAVANPPSEA